MGKCYNCGADTYKINLAAAALLKACERMIYLKDLWVPNSDEALNNEEYRAENMALVNVFKQIQEAVKIAKG